MSKSDECSYCEENPEVLASVKEGYAVMWDEVVRERTKLMKQGYSEELALTTAIDSNLIYVTGSKICQIKSQQAILNRFWKYYMRTSRSMSIKERFNAAIEKTVRHFSKEYPNAWKCFIGIDFEKKVVHG